MRVSVTDYGVALVDIVLAASGIKHAILRDVVLTAEGSQVVGFDQLTIGCGDLIAVHSSMRIAAIGHSHFLAKLAAVLI